MKVKILEDTGLNGTNSSLIAAEQLSVKKNSTGLASEQNVNISLTFNVKLCRSNISNR